MLLKKVLSVLILLMIVTLITGSIQASTIPNPTSSFYVNDYANVLSNETEQLIIKHSSELARSTGAQIVVVTIESLGGQVLETFSLNMLNQWGIGDKTKNNGVLILLSIVDRKSRIEIGYGLESLLTKVKLDSIYAEYMRPFYSSNNFDTGMKNGYLAILKEVSQSYGLDVSSIEIVKPRNFLGIPSNWMGFVTAIPFMIFMLALIFISRRRNRNGAATNPMLGQNDLHNHGGGFDGGGGSGGGSGSSGSF